MKLLEVIRFVQKNCTTDRRKLAEGIKPFSSREFVDGVEDGPRAVQCSAKQQTLASALDAISSSAKNGHLRRRKLVKQRLGNVVMRQSKPKEDVEQMQTYLTGGGETFMTCRRCNGWTTVFSPHVQNHGQCNREAMHPCISCTPFRPPPLTSIYSR